MQYSRCGLSTSEQSSRDLISPSRCAFIVLFVRVLVPWQFEQ